MQDRTQRSADELDSESADAFPMNQILSGVDNITAQDDVLLSVRGNEGKTDDGSNRVGILGFHEGTYL